MSTTTDAIMIDRDAKAMFLCGRCAEPLTEHDFFDLGMRLPEPGESRDEYFDAELLDEIVHERCVGAQRSSR
jgi:hypothetical protein